MTRHQRSTSLTPGGTESRYNKSSVVGSRCGGGRFADNQYISMNAKSGSAYRPSSTSRMSIEYESSSYTRSKFDTKPYHRSRDLSDPRITLRSDNLGTSIDGRPRNFTMPSRSTYRTRDLSPLYSKNRGNESYSDTPYQVRDERLVLGKGSESRGGRGEYDARDSRYSRDYCDTYSSGSNRIRMETRYKNRESRCYGGRDFR